METNTDIIRMRNYLAVSADGTQQADACKTAIRALTDLKDSITLHRLRNKLTPIVNLINMIDDKNSNDKNIKLSVKLSKIAINDLIGDYFDIE